MELEESKSKSSTSFLDFSCEYHTKYLDQILPKIDFDSMSREEKYINLRLFAFGMPISYVRSLSEGKHYKKWAREFDPFSEELESEDRNINEIAVQYAKRFSSEMIMNGWSLFFYGNNARGKTYSSLFIAYLLLKSSDNFTFHYTHFRDLVMLYRKIYNNEATEMDKDYYDLLLDVDLLILDEIGGKEGSSTDFVVTFFEDLIRYRSNRCLPMIICGNIKPALKGDLGDDLNSIVLSSDDSTIRKKYGQSVYSAMTEKFKFFEFSSKQNKDFRERSKWNV